jgi:hypothetical protein
MNRNRIIVGLLAALAVALAVFFVTSERGREAPSTADPAELTEGQTEENSEPSRSDASSGSEVSESAEQVGGRDGSSTQSPEPAEEFEDQRNRAPLEGLTEEEIQVMERERIERVEEFHAQNDGPIQCENVCDCPTGLDCRIPPGICVPATGNARCCSDEDCPEGEPCTRPNGRSGICGE